MRMHSDFVQCSWLGTRGLKVRRTARGVTLMLAVICTLFCAHAVPACTCISLKGGLDTVNEVFRILDHFNLAAPGAEGADLATDQQLPSGTQWTTVSDAKNRVFYWHTAWNRRVRMIDLKKIDFRRVRFQRIPLDRERKQDIEEVHAK